MYANVLLTVEAPIDAADIVRGLDNNDEQILIFITQVLEEAESSELRETLAEKLKTWEEDRKSE